MGGTSGPPGTKSRFKKQGRSSRIGRLMHDDGGRLKFTSSISLVGRGGDAASLLADREAEFITVKRSYIPEMGRGGGYGQGMYVAALQQAKKEGKGLRSDWLVSEAAQRVWRSLRAKGVRMTVSARGELRAKGIGAADAVKGLLSGQDAVYTISAEEVQRLGTSSLPWESLEASTRKRRA